MIDQVIGTSAAGKTLWSPLTRFILLHDAPGRDRMAAAIQTWESLGKPEMPLSRGVTIHDLSAWVDGLVPRHSLWMVEQWLAEAATHRIRPKQAGSVVPESPPNGPGDAQQRSLF